MKKFKITTTIVLTTISVLIFSLNAQTVSESVKNSLAICYNSVIPSLLPFFILCEFLMQLCLGITLSANLLAFGGGLITGFPTGIKNVCTLYQNGSLTNSQATSLLHCCANASPAYIVAFIGGHIIKDRSIGMILLISQVLTAIVCGLFFGAFKKSAKTKPHAIILTTAACNAVCESVLSCLYVCGYIIFFGIFADILLSTEIISSLPWQSQSVIIGCIEITRGVKLIEFSDPKAIIFLGFILAFSGVSVIMQCINCTAKAGLDARSVVLGKLSYTLVMPALAYMFIKLNATVPIIICAIALLICAVLIYNIFDKSGKRIYNK